MIKQTKKLMQRRDFLKTGTAGSVGLMADKSSLGSVLRALSENDSAISRDAMGADTLAAGFAAPPKTAKPHTWWHWMDGNVTKEGITADLEAMDRIGLGGVQVFNVSYQIPPGPIKYNTPEWLEMMRFAAQEADRLGMEMAMHNCSGWSSSGGPWITPENGMQRVAWTETRAKGPSKFRASLPAAISLKYQDFFRDISVIAYRTPAAEQSNLKEANPTLSVSDGQIPAQPFSHLAGRVEIEFPVPSDEKPNFILLEFEKPFAARSFYIDYSGGHGNIHLELQSSDDGKEFNTVASENIAIKGRPSISFPETTARFFRIHLTGKPTPDQTRFRIESIDLLNGYRLPDWPKKAGFEEFRAPFVFEPSWDEVPPAGTTYERDHIIDISTSMKRDGTLEWDVPEGDWTILRFGYAPIDRVQAHPEKAGAGLEVDKMSRPALDQHFDNIIQSVLKEMGPLAGKSFTTLLIDSYEVGTQNWTPKFREEFKTRRGYDLTPYLLAFTGRVVGTNEITERFLWDVRRTIADLYHDNYYGYFTELCHQRGLKAAFEAYSGPYDTLGCSDSADLPMGEFWTGGGYRHSNARNRQVISSAHLNGRAVVGAESYTSGFGADRYTEDPYALKSLGDFQFCEGINKFIFHRYAMQPWLDKKPGMTMGPWGLHFDRGVTWWEQGRDWIKYITRCQYLLQSGKPVADVLCFAGEDAQAQAHWAKSLTPPVPEGYDYEFIHLASLRTAKADDGQILLSNGLKYRVLILPDARYLTSQVIEKLVELVNGGAVIVGPPPLRTPSLSNYPACDTEVHKAAAELWGDLDGNTKTERTVGRGKVIWGKRLEDVLAGMRYEQDFTFVSTGLQPRICYKHRNVDGAEVYFVSNQQDEAVTIEASFRVSGKSPELWRADTGKLEPAAVYKNEAGRVTLPLVLDPGGSVFVIFRGVDAVDHVVSASLPSASQEASVDLHANSNTVTLNAWSAGEYKIRTSRGRNLDTHVATVAAPLPLNDQWDVSFPPELGAPTSIKLEKLVSLSKHDDPGVRYFSGTATYTRSFEATAAMLARSQDLYLDLGLVKNVVELRVNDKYFGVLWKPPFMACITSALRPGKNRLEVQVTNVWANRLIGDEELPDDREWIKIPDRGWMMREWPEWFVKNQPRPSKRIAFSTWKFYAQGEPLPDSGLIGPVQVHSVEKIKLRLS